MRNLFIACLLLAALFAQGCVSSSKVIDPELARLAARAERVEIIRDDYGVPHVYGQTDADTVFGLLYAQAEDDFPRIERNYIWAIGRLAEVEGETALYSDLRARLYMTRAEAEAAYDSAPAWLQALCDAWADGLNYYLATHSDVRPMLLDRFEPWMPMYFSEGSIGGDIERIPLDRLARFYGADAMVATAAVALDDRWFPAQGGSNGFAINGERIASGKSMLLINPHTSFYFRGEVHAVSEEGLNAYGAVTWGQFFVYQGFNEHTGWMHTSTYVDFIDEFIEDVRAVDGGGHQYRYGDEWRSVDALPVTLRYRDDDGVAERTFTMYRTHHGPITHAIDGRWVATKINWEPVNALRQSYQRTKLANYDEFRDMMDIRTNSSNNTVFADSSGNIAYFHGNFVPRRDTRFDFSKPVDGSDPSTDWQGLHDVDEIVTVLNPAGGWIQNANSTPFTAAGDDSPIREDYPVYMAPDPENFRGVHAVRLLSQAKELTLDGLMGLAHDPYMPGFEQLIGGLVDAENEAVARDDDAREALAVLRAWDMKTGSDSVAMTLAHFYGNRYLRSKSLPASLSEMEKINALGTDTQPAERLAVFAETLDALSRDFGDWRLPWSTVNRYQRLSGAINLNFDDDQPSIGVGFANSRWGALADFGAVEVPNANKLYGTTGNSFAAVVQFGDRLQAKSILVGGQSNDPDSPHFDDQVKAYVEADWKDVAFYKPDVLARATSRYRPGDIRR
ncbi:MAG: penicillin acylase family protein [Pseudomonadota bacterium]